MLARTMKLVQLVFLAVHTCREYASDRTARLPVRVRSAFAFVERRPLADVCALTSFFCLPQ